MANKVVVDLESIAKGEKVEVLYLGVFENGATHDLTDEQVASYEAVSRRKFPSSGYLFAGKPKGDVQKAAFEKNADEELEFINVDTEQKPTQIDARVTSPTDKVEGVSTEKEGGK